MAKVSDVLSVLEQFAPYELAESWDNVGLLVGDRHYEIKTVLCALDITERVVDEAIEIGANLIVAHHPVIFTSVNAVTSDSTTGKIIIKMLKNDISGICMHTNADCADGGVNDLLAEKLQLMNIEILGAGETGTLGRIGEITNEMQLIDFVRTVQNQHCAGGVRYTNGGKLVKKVAVLGGGGGKLMDFAIKKGADTYVIGDCSYDIMMRAYDLGLNLIDAGHFPTENAIAEGFCKLISEKVCNIEVKTSKNHKDCINFI